MDNISVNISALTPVIVDSGALAKLPPNGQTIEPLDLVEEPEVRSKIRLYAILAALYVYYLS